MAKIFISQFCSHTDPIQYDFHNFSCINPSSKIDANLSVTSIPFPIDVRLEQKPLVSDESFWFSLAAILVSFYSIYLNRKHTDKARRESIHDHFWFREVIYPEIIKPISEFSNDLHNNLPSDDGTLATRRKISNNFFNEFREKHNYLSQMLLRASLINKSLYKNISKEFSNVEDVVTEYCYLNSTSKQTRDRDRVEALDKIFIAHTNILGHAKESQESIT